VPGSLVLATLGAALAVVVTLVPGRRPALRVGAAAREPIAA
jgi:hypothetical protein